MRRRLGAMRSRLGAQGTKLAAKRADVPTQRADLANDSRAQVGDGLEYVRKAGIGHELEPTGGVGDQQPCGTRACRGAGSIGDGRRLHDVRCDLYCLGSRRKKRERERNFKSRRSTSASRGKASDLFVIVRGERERTVENSHPIPTYVAVGLRKPGILTPNEPVTSMRLRMLAPLSVVAVVTLSATSRAEDNSAAVQALFAQGKQLMAEGKTGLACPKFLASYELEKRIGTLLNLADCYEKNGQLASAWARYLEAMPLTERAGQGERLTFATDHAAALEPKLARLTVVAPPNVSGLVVKRDNLLVEPRTVGTEIPVDVGTHVIDASAPGKVPWTTRVVILENGERKSVSVPPFTTAAGTGDSSPAGAKPSSPPVLTRVGPNGRTVAGLVIGGVGVACLGIGTGFGVAALGKDSDASPYCGQNGAGKNDCSSDGVAHRSDAVTNGNLSTIFFAVGTALVAGGLVLWLTAPSRRSDATARPRSGLVF